MTTASGRLRPSPATAGLLSRRGARRRSATERTAPLRIADREEPWNRRAGVVPAILLALGVIGMVVGWVGISDTADLEEQARWLGLGIGSLIVAGIGMVVWLLAGLVSVSTMRRSVMHDLAIRYPADVPQTALTAEQPLVGQFGIATGMRRYHRPDCDVLIGKTVQWQDEEFFLSAGTTPCGMCLPDATSGSARE